MNKSTTRRIYIYHLVVGVLITNKLCNKQAAQTTIELVPSDSRKTLMQSSLQASDRPLTSRRDHIAKKALFERMLTEHNLSSTNRNLEKGQADKKASSVKPNSVLDKKRSLLRDNRETTKIEEASDDVRCRMEQLEQLVTNKTITSVFSDLGAGFLTPLVRTRLQRDERSHSKMIKVVTKKYKNNMSFIETERLNSMKKDLMQSMRLSSLTGSDIKISTSYR